LDWMRQCKAERQARNPINFQESDAVCGPPGNGVPMHQPPSDRKGETFTGREGKGGRGKLFRVPRGGRYCP